MNGFHTMNWKVESSSILSQNVYPGSNPRLSKPGDCSRDSFARSDIPA
jgi:hypothetical protein